MKTLQASIHRALSPLLLVALCMAGAADIAQAQTTQALQAQQQARAEQVQAQLRASALREQQRQQTTDTLRKAFPSNQAQQGIDQANQAQNQRNQAQQRNRVQDYLHREQAEATAHSADAQPARAKSSH